MRLKVGSSVCATIRFCWTRKEKATLVVKFYVCIFLDNIMLCDG